MSTEQDVFVLADRELLGVVEQISTEQWELAAPDWFPSFQPGQSLRQVINAHAYDEAFLPDTLAGRTMAEVGDEHAGDLLGDDPQAAFAALTRAGIATVQALSPDRLDTPVHLSYGDFPAREYLQHITTYRGFRVYTISRWLGFDTRMDPALVDGLREIVAPSIDQWRAMGVFPDPVPVPAGADEQTELLGLVGFLHD